MNGDLFLAAKFGNISATISKSCMNQILADITMQLQACGYEVETMVTTKYICEKPCFLKLIRETRLWKNQASQNFNLLYFKESKQWKVVFNA